MSNSPMFPTIFPALKGKKIHLGVCGSVAAYKAIELMRALQQSGLEVSVTLTEAAQRFITPLAFTSLGAEHVYTDMFSDTAPFEHLAPGMTHDAFVVVPATATTLARVAHGMADSMLAAQALAFPCPVLFAPAMNPRMWANAATQSNIARLQELQHCVVPPACGVVACGDTGQGKLASLDEIYYQIIRTLCSNTQHNDLQGKRILITLGPTREMWDGARCWSNLSTGYMGACLALAAWVRGAEVHAIAGPGVPALPAGVQRIEVESAKDMYEAAQRIWDSVDAGIFTAAVADFSPVPFGAAKFKKTGESLSIQFQPNADILAALGARKKSTQRILGFAAETEQIEAYTEGKRIRKNADLMAGNRINVAGSGFASATNAVFVTDSRGKQENWPELPKPQVAWRLLDWLFSL